ncbi:uncharacterized protein LOC26528526 [Drosophila mojavensis]|uniref:Uncharacterized protein n=1 Tax=Drosophila mojavensis TaxID=7230 RepID=A0A0Q9X5Z1_DROMO|nr:uncharacterized protein LOC26528526 [Drosophila mojavensis]KRG03269.1 uncharacterized protein Dmoj_GI26885 [Drosophila mojavensis]
MKGKTEKNSKARKRSKIHIYKKYKYKGNREVSVTWRRKNHQTGLTIQVRYYAKFKLGSIENWIGWNLLKRRNYILNESEDLGSDEKQEECIKEKPERDAVVMNTEKIPKQEINMPNPVSVNVEASNWSISSIIELMQNKEDWNATRGGRNVSPADK